MTKPTPEAKRAATPQFNFNRRSLAAAIKKHPATAGQRYLRDAGTRGLVLELTPAGNAAFQAYFKHLGRPKRVTLGRFDPLLPDARQLPDAATQDPLSFIAARPDLSVTMARDLAATVRAAIAAGASPTRHAAALRADPTVGDLLDEYVMHLEQGGKRRNSAESARAALAHLTPLRHTRATDLVRGEVAALHKRVGKQFPTMANRAVLDTLRAAFNLALKNGRIAHRDNPATRIDRFTETQRERFLSGAELALLRRAYANERQDFRDLFELLLATGARKSAVLLMRHADVDLDRAEWRVPAEHSKSGQPYTVPLMPPVVDLLKRLRASSNGVRVFSFAAASLDRAWQRTFAQMKRLRLLDALHLPETSAKSIAELTAEAVRRRLPPTDYAVEHCTIHDLRRTTGSHAAIAGVGLHLVGAMLGHTSQRATKVYARLSQDALRDAAKLANATLAAPAAKAPVIPIKRGRG